MSKRHGDWWRGQAFLAALVLGALGVLGWCGYLQYREAPRYQARVERQQLKIVSLPARRGTIVDRKGRILAVSTRQTSVWADPSFLEDRRRAGEQLAGALYLDAPALADRIEQRADKRFVWIKRFITDEEAQRVEGLGLRGVVVETEYRREYPMGTLAAHVLGFTDIDGRGLEGVEAQYDADLAGEPGEWRLRSDAWRRPIGTQEGCRPARHGHNLVLTLDAVVQSTVEDQLELTVEKFHAAGAAGVVMDPRTGEVLALANYPTFSPESARQSGAEVRRNRALTDPVEPGSTFKPFTVASALEGGFVSTEQRIFCHNGFYTGKGIGLIREYENHGYGELSVIEVIARSSNIGAAKIAQIMGKKYFFGMIEKFGFGVRTGIDLPGEGPGILLPFKEWRWGEYALTRSAYGQGAVATTPLQLLRGFCCLCNGGRLVRPRVSRGVLSAEGAVLRDLGDDAQAATAPQVISAEVSRQMVQEVLRAVVELPGGTARSAAVEGYAVFGKTGTAQMPRKNGKGYEDGKYVASFLAGAPADNPRICVLVLVIEPDRRLGLGYTGGRVAAPAAREILSQTLPYLGVEKEPTPTSGPAAVAARR